MNRSRIGTPLGQICWTIDEIAISQIVGTYGSISETLKLQPADPVLGLRRLDAALATSDAVTTAAAQLPPSTQPFTERLITDIAGARDERASQIGMDAKSVLAIIFTKYFDFEAYDATDTFSTLAATDDHCDL